MSSIRNIDYQIKLIQFPTGKVHESVVLNEDDSYTIFIDCSLSKQEQRESFIHAMKHILGDDFCKKDIQRIEYESHRIECSEELFPYKVLNVT